MTSRPLCSSAKSRALEKGTASAMQGRLKASNAVTASDSRAFLECETFIRALPFAWPRRMPHEIARAAHHSCVGWDGLVNGPEIMRRGGEERLAPDDSRLPARARSGIRQWLPGGRPVFPVLARAGNVRGTRWHAHRRCRPLN